ERNAFMQQVYNASFKEVPSNFKPLLPQEIELAVKDPYGLPSMPQQEPGIRDSSALEYELYVDGALDSDKKSFGITFNAADHLFGTSALGAPFNVYAPGNYLQEDRPGDGLRMEALKAWPYAVRAGDTIASEWPLDHFENREYHLRVYGPNGFFREFAGNVSDP